jgi:MFS family permease
MNQQTKSLARASFIVGLATCFYLYEFFLRVMPTVITQELIQDFNISTSTLGHLLAGFFYAYALMQIPAGILCDKYGPKLCLTVSVAVCAAATFLFQATDNFWVAEIARMAIGAVSACAFIGPLTLSARWFEDKHQALVAGMVQVMGCVGAIFAGPPVAMLVDTYGWRTSLYYSAWVGVVLAFSYLWFIQDYPDHEAQHEEEDKTEPIATLLKNVSNNPQSWYVGLLAFGSWAPIAIFAESWGIPFLSLLQDISRQQATEQVMWVWIAMAIASPVAGWWSDYWQLRKAPTLILLGIGFVASSILVCYPPTTPWMVSCLLALLGISSAAQPITFGMVNDHNKPAAIGTAVAVNNMALIASAMVLQPLTGALIDWSQGVHAAPSLIHYQQAFACVPICCLATMLICVFLTQETHCQDQSDAQADSSDTDLQPAENL